MDLLEDQGCGYIFGLSNNARLSKIGQPWREDVAVRRALSGKDKVRRFFQTGYRAKSWSRERKVIARVEATSKGADGCKGNTVPSTVVRGYDLRKPGGHLGNVG